MNNHYHYHITSNHFADASGSGGAGGGFPLDIQGPGPTKAQMLAGTTTAHNLVNSHGSPVKTRPAATSPRVAYASPRAARGRTAYPSSQAATRVTRSSPTCRGDP